MNEGSVLRPFIFPHFF